MIELQLNEFEKVRELFSEVGYNLNCMAVIAGINPGRIWVDSKEKPTSGLLVDNVWAFFLAGNPNNSEFNASIRKILKDELFPIAKDQEKITYGEWIIYFESQDWLDKIENELGIKDPVPEKRYHYLFEKMLIPNWREKIPKGFVMRKMDESLLKQEKLENLDDAKGWITSHYGSKEKFLELGSGFCLVENDEKIASWCVSDWSEGNRIEIGIVTANEYRRRGFATLCTAAHVEYYHKKGYQIGWHCYETNEASWRTAEKVGFRRNKSYIAACGYYNEKSHLVFYARYIGFVLDQPEIGLQYINKALAMGPERRHYYVYAELLAKLNRNAEAIDALMKITEMDHPNPAFFKHYLETHGIFEELRKMKEWKELMKSVELLIKE
jgi:RimJ/RimL family protein N-acetyltransferase